MGVGEQLVVEAFPMLSPMSPRVSCCWSGMSERAQGAGCQVSSPSSRASSPLGGAAVASRKAGRQEGNHQAEGRGPGTGVKEPPARFSSRRFFRAKT